MPYARRRIRWYRCCCCFNVDGEKRSSSSLRFAEKICAAVIPIVAIIEALILAVSGCFDCEKPSQRKKSRCGYQEIVRLSEESRCKAKFDGVIFFFQLNLNFGTGLLWFNRCYTQLVSVEDIQTFMYAYVYFPAKSTPRRLLDLISYWFWQAILIDFGWFCSYCKWSGGIIWVV